MNKENKEPYFTNQAFYLIAKMGVTAAKQEWTRKNMPFVFFFKAENKYKTYLCWLNKYQNENNLKCHHFIKKIRF